MKKSLICLVAVLMTGLFVQSKDFYGSHLTSASPWINKIHVFNTGNGNAEFQLKIMDSSGTQVLQETYLVSEFDYNTYVLTSLGDYQLVGDEIALNPVEGSFVISTDSDQLIPLLSYQYGSSQSLSQFFLPETTGSAFLLPNMKADHFSWTGLAVMNINESELTVTLEAFQDGVSVGQTQADIQPLSKFVDISDNIWNGLGLNDFDQVIVSSDTTLPAPILITGNEAQDRHVFFTGIQTTIGSSSEMLLSYPIVDTGQTVFYDNSAVISSPLDGEAFYGQDAQYLRNTANYTDNGDGTVTDNVTDLMWQQDPGDKMTLTDAVAGAGSFSLAGYDDWRLPTIKELYSLILFTGEDPSGYSGTSTEGLVPFMDTEAFVFNYGNTSSGERIIDSQMATSTFYTSTTMGGNETMFGVNFADGRIKGYPAGDLGPGGAKTYFVYHVRGNAEYGQNDFQDNEDGTVTDNATGLMWAQSDNGEGVVWENALSYAENSVLAEYSDWRLPNAKELQSIVDYSRSPDYTGSAAIDPIFSCTSIINEAGEADFPFYWSSTTHANMNVDASGGGAAYVSFGRALGYWNDNWEDVHGAGAQRSDPKTGDPADFPEGHGPQGDAIRIYNHVRCVRDVK